MRRSHRPEDPDLDSALDAMTAEDLRSVLRYALERLDDEPRGRLVDTLIARAAKGSSDWRPASPSHRIVDEVKKFAEAARRVGQAEPHDVDHYLRQGTKAFLADEHATAREVFAALLPPVAGGEVYLGEHEMVTEVLSVDAQQCVAQYVASVYTTTPLEDRAEAICDAIGSVHEMALFWTPLDQMERVSTGPLPELDTFLPLWVEHLERQPSSEAEWEGDRDHWLREAALRLEGVEGLERIARKTEKPQALQAWCETLVERGEWARALRAYDVATELIGKSHWLGGFLDGAALAAQQLGARDATRRLEAAWLGAPSMVRLLRWLGAGTPATSTLLKRARKAIEHCPAKSGRQLGLLDILNADVQGAAKLLARAPGLGWSSEDHPGHVLFPAFAGFLAAGTRATISSELFGEIEESPRERWDMDRDDCDRPKLLTPSIARVIAMLRSAANIGAKERAAMLDAMRTAAQKRVDGVLRNKRRRHYRHAATLVACCVELASVAGKEKAIGRWRDDLCQQHSRFYAFQKELRSALGALSS